MPRELTCPKPTHEQSNRERLITARDAAGLLRLSLSWLAKARMRGDGPPYVKLGRSVRYGESALAEWTRSRTRSSTSER
jgi:predicted DNA-binding transcriptional regulator AlpA